MVVLHVFREARIGNKPFRKMATSKVCMLFLDSKIENTYSTCKAILIVHKIKITSIKNIGKRERGKGKEEENVDGSIVCDLNETVSIRNERLESL